MRMTIGTQMTSMLTLRYFTSFLFIHLFISLCLHNTLILWHLELRTWNQVLRPVPLSLFIPALYLMLRVSSFIFYLPSITPLDFKGSPMRADCSSMQLGFNETICSLPVYL